MEEENKASEFLVDKEVWSNYPQLEKTGYVKIFTVIGEYFPVEIEKVVSGPYKIGFVFNDNFYFNNVKYKERSLWVPKAQKASFINKFYTKIINQLHPPEEAEVINFILSLLIKKGISWEPQEAIYNDRFYEISYPSFGKLRLLIDEKFKKVTIWDQNQKTKLNDFSVSFDNLKWKAQLENYLTQISNES